ncbi:MAG: histidine kinase [Lachnospiraceae bacterium]|jgi:sensor histidine kinase YesM|nr:histidine kinase [Lachnospiraceae bacterium]
MNVMESLKNTRLRTKLYGIVMFSVFCPLITAMVLFNLYTAARAQEQANQSMYDTFSQTYELLSTRFELVRQNILLMLLDGNSRRLIQEYSGTTDMFERKALKDKAGAIVDFVESREGIDRLYVYVPDAYTEIMDYKNYFPMSELENVPNYRELVTSNYRNTWTYDSPTRQAPEAQGGLPAGSAPAASVPASPVPETAIDVPASPMPETAIGVPAPPIPETAVGVPASLAPETTMGVPTPPVPETAASVPASPMPETGEAGLPIGGDPRTAGDADDYHQQVIDGKISYLVRVCDIKDYSRTVAVLRLDISLQLVEDILSQAISMQGSSIYLLGDGSPVAMGGRGAAPELLEPLARRSFLDVIETTYRDVGVDYVILSRTFKNHPWELRMVVPKNKGLNLLNLRQWWYIVSFTIFAGVLCFIVSLMFSSRIAGRLNTVSASMKHLRNGMPEPLPLPRSRDEIGELYESYNYLSDKLTKLFDAQKITDKNLKNAELRALRAQINPHFLYNSLELVNYHAYRNDAAAVSEVVELLSRFYKLSLNKQGEFCEIWKELELTNCYFRIQNMRYHDLITLTIDVPVDLYQYRMPHILLQPLVENAVYHGIMKRPGSGGEIRISGGLDGGDIILTVSDDGAGMDGETLQLLNGHSRGPGAGEYAGEYAPEPAMLAGAPPAAAAAKPQPDGGVAPSPGTQPPAHPDSSHYGISNINERLVGYYGESYRLVFESTPMRGTTVRIRIPAR